MNKNHKHHIRQTIISHEQKPQTSYTTNNVKVLDVEGEIYWHHYTKQNKS